MAGGNHHAAGEAAVLDGIGERWSGRVVVGQQHVDPGRRDHFADGSGEGARGEAGVISDGDAFFGIFTLDYIVGDSTGSAANILKGEIVGNNAAPSIGAELYWFHQHSSKIMRNFRESPSEQLRQLLV